MNKHDHFRNEAVEFQCLAFVLDHAAINIINAVDKTSSCFELKPPEDDQNAVCPSLGNCETIRKTGGTFPSYGFYECKCDEKVSNTIMLL